MFGKRKIAALTAEFLGTAVLALTFLTVSRSTIGIPYFVGLAAGIAVLLMGVSLMRDVHLNPAYTFALLTARRIKASKAIVFILVQLAGAFLAAELYKYLTNAPVQDLPGSWDPRVFGAELVGALVFGFAAAGVMYRRANVVVRAVVVGAAYTLGVMIASSAANGFINPAVALASSGWGWLTTVLGPIVGAVIGVNLYGVLFATGDGKAEAAVAKAEIKADEAVEKAVVKAEAVTAPVKRKVGRPKGSTAKKTTKK